MIFMMTRSNKRKQAQAQQLQSALTVGAQVRTIGGLLGDLIEVTDEYVVIETTPGVKLKFAKNAIAGLSQPPGPDAGIEPFGGEPEAEAGEGGSDADAESEPKDAVSPFDEARSESPFATPRADSETGSEAGSDQEIDAVLAPESESANR